MKSKGESPSRDAGGIIEWDALDEADRIKFEHAFMPDDARFARTAATFGKKGSGDIAMASNLWRWQRIERALQKYRVRRGQG